MHCHLLIPDFLTGAVTEAAGRLGAAETLIARGRRRRLAAISPEQWLFERFEVPKQRDWPVAPCTLLADGGIPDEHFWLRADPVHLGFERDRLIFADSAVFELSRAEAEALVETLNRHFGEAMLFYPLRPERWYVRLGRAPDMETIPPSAVRGKAIGACLPAGADAMRFHSLMNEAQMLLHEHPVNVGREARGEPAINSVWFWGGGSIDLPKIRPFTTVIGNDPLASGLAQAAGIPSRALPRNAASLLDATAGEGVALIVLDALRQAAGYADAMRLREQRAALERDWLEPLRVALQSGRIGMLSLHLPGEDALLEVEIVRADLRYFWRRRKPLSVYV